MASSAISHPVTALLISACIARLPEAGDPWSGRANLLVCDLCELYSIIASAGLFIFLSSCSTGVPMSHPSRTLASVLGLAVAGTAYVYAARPVTRPARTATPALAPLQRQVLDQYCVTCHNERLKTGGLVLEKKIGRAAW